MYNEVFGTQITENLTGVVKEDHERVKTVTDILEEVKQEMCDDYCKYPTIVMIEKIYLQITVHVRNAR